jgi:hypothetical protein
MNVELVTDERRPQLLWRGTFKEFVRKNAALKLDWIPIGAVLGRGDEFAIYDNGERRWLRPDIGEWAQQGEEKL